MIALYPFRLVVPLLWLSLALTAQTSLQVLHKHVPLAVGNGRAAKIRALPSNEKLLLGFHLPVRNHAELLNLLDQISDPQNANYRHWLSVDEFTERFGPTAEDYEKVVDYAQANGLTVVETSPNRLLLHVSATTVQIERAFHVHLNIYQHPTEDRTFYSTDSEPSVSLTVPLSHISGLNNYSLPRPAARPGLKVGPHPRGSGPSGTLLGSDMRSAYNMGANTGTGQVVALVEFSGYNPNDIRTYFNNIGQTNSVPIINVAVDGSNVTNYTDPNNEGEVCLDIEQTASVAPGLSSIRVYIANSFGTDGDILNKIVTDNIAKQISNSWYWYPDDPAVDEPYFEEAAAQGQSIFSISGDGGAYTGSDSTDESYPGEDPHVTTVGGTVLQTFSNGSYNSESAWIGSGGGPANDGTTYFSIPPWQTSAINSTNQGSLTLRNSPDVALQADYVNYICFNGSCATNWGGTSFATPRWAAYLALVNQQLVADGQPAGLGFLNPTLYRLGQGVQYNSDFHDIVAGNDQSRNQSVYWTAVPGYDLVTGWGSMNGTNLMADLVQPAFSISAANVDMGKNSSASVTITVLSTLGFGGSISLGASGFEPGIAASFSPATVTLPANGTATSQLTISTSHSASPGEFKIDISGISSTLSANTTMTLTVAGAPHAVWSGWLPTYESKPRPTLRPGPEDQ